MHVSLVPGRDMHRLPPSCSSTRFPIEVLINTHERSSTTITSFFPSTCNVGVAYPSEKTAAEIGPATLNPDTETQNLLQDQMPSGQRVNKKRDEA